MIDVHITTCHHSTVRCRPRVREHPRANVKEWTPEERLDISKTSVRSLINFIKSSGRKDDLLYTLIDDGSDMPEAVRWIKEISKDINIERGLHRGSSAGINAHFQQREFKDDDLIVHFEDDHIAFNPFKLDWIDICHKILTSKTSIDNNVGVITFRSGFPTSPLTPGYHGAWGPKGWIDGEYSAPLFSALGNAHHAMLYKTYKQFLPLSGSSGGCEATMNNRMIQLGIKTIELQDHIYMFHSHLLCFPIDESNCTTNEWNLTGMGREYGIKDMDDYLRAKKKIICMTLNESVTIEGTYHYD